MGGRLARTEAEQERELRVAAVAAYRRHLEMLQAEFVEAMNDLAWPLIRESSAASELISSHQRVAEDFFASQLDAITMRLSAGLKVLTMQLPADEVAPYGARTGVLKPKLAMSTCSKTDVTCSSALHRYQGSNPSPVAGRTDQPTWSNTPVAGTDTLAMIESVGCNGPTRDPARTQRVVRKLLAEWLRVEREEAQAVVDDAAARVAMLQHSAMVSGPVGDAGVNEIQVSPTRPQGFLEVMRGVELDADPVAHIAAMIDALAGGAPLLGASEFTRTVRRDRAAAALVPQRCESKLFDDDDVLFEEAFRAFWSPASQRTDVVARDSHSSGSPLAVVSDESGIEAVGLTVEDASCRDAMRSRQRSASQARARFVRMIAIGLRPIVGTAAAVVLAMVVIG